MKKRGARIKNHRIAPPTLVAMQLAPEVSTQERMAVYALTQPWGDTKHFNVLLDCQHMLTIAAEHKGDREAVEMARFADIAMKNIRDRWKKTGKVRATGDELQALNLLVDYSEGWWKRQSGALFADAFAALDKLRGQQKEAA